MVRPAKLSRHAVESDPNLPWNTFVDIVALGSYDELSDVQRIAHLVFSYESEVQNGGHFQYFENQGVAHAAETIAALQEVGAHAHAGVLAAAVTVFRSKSRSPARDVDEFVEEALEAEYEEFDESFHSYPEELQAHLERYFSAHEADFVEIA